jgi:4-hydroxy-tetrahydrodipicolinate synthase
MSGVTGVVPALVTPFRDDGSVDESSLVRAVTHQIESGADGLLILGLAGEGIYLSVEERQRVAHLVLAAAQGTPILVGCTADTTEDACELVAAAASAGAAEVMVAPPRQPDWTRAQLREHFRLVAASTTCDVRIQDAPFAIGVELGVEFVLGLAKELPNVRSYKVEALPYWDNAVRAREAAGDALRVLGGHGGLYLMDVLDSGADGLIPGADLTASLVDAWRAYHAGDRQCADAIYRQLLPFLVYEAQSMGLLIGGAKLILQQRGIIASQATRHPHASLSSVTESRMLHIAKVAGIV